MVDTSIPYQIVVFTHEHSISGGVFLRDRRLSDFLNDQRDTSIMVRTATVARLENPGKILEKTPIAFIPKTGIVLAFEPPQPMPPTSPRFIKYPKEKYEVFLVMDGMEARGEIHMQGALDLVHVLAEPVLPFLPITRASVSIQANPSVLLRQEAILVNIQHIRFIGELQTKSTV